MKSINKEILKEKLAIYKALERANFADKKFIKALKEFLEIVIPTLEAELNDE
ncbi:MAG: hypothetical protein ACFFDN_00770 [Candidatus Hodarchaeota archaeon]